MESTWLFLWRGRKRSGRNFGLGDKVGKGGERVEDRKKEVKGILVRG
jgi:hypothetical protein